MYKKYILFFSFIISLIFCGCLNEQPQEGTREGNQEQVVSKKILSSNEVEKELRKLSEGLDVKYDDMKEIRYYQCPKMYEIGIYLLPYVSVDKDYNVQIYDLPVVFGDNWIFFDEVYIKFGDQLHRNSYKNKKRETNVNGKYITESYNIEMLPEWYKILSESLDQPNIKIRFSGKYDVDKTLSEAEKKSIKKVFAIYKFLSDIEVNNEKKINVAEQMISENLENLKEVLAQTADYSLPIQQGNFEQAKITKEKIEAVKKKIRYDSVKFDEKNLKLSRKVHDVVIYRAFVLDYYIKIVEKSNKTGKINTVDKKMMDEYWKKSEMERQEILNEYGF